MTVPDWVQDSIFYQIFPDRFMNGDPSNDPPAVLSWDMCATPRGFHGGDLRGIIQRMDYLVDLGITAIYLNPIFLSPSNHRYNTVDYFRIDPKLGTLEDFHELVDTAHRNHIRVILDGVFNHCGRGFFAFNDILENNEFSPYLNWFHIKHFPVDAYSPGEASDYEAWWGIKSLPKFNTQEPQVRKYLFQVARYWMEQGIDGWRLDVPNEIDDDSFWSEFRQVVLSVNPQAYLVGEIWDAIPRWVGDTHFDGLMDYPFRTALLGLLAGSWTPVRFGRVIDNLLSVYPPENNHSMLVLLGSHDTERLATLLDEDWRKVRLAIAFQFAYPGAPCIYYGDEIGLLGGKDPECRGGFPWDPAYWNTDLRDWYKKLVALRKNSDALRRGDFQTFLADDAQSVYAFTRHTDCETVLMIANLSNTPRTLQIRVTDWGWENDRDVHDLLSGETFRVSQEVLYITLSAWGSAWVQV
jgi:cyclomaltodextrinase / maltogenic alpha-amylase / neopullulanase